MGAEIIKVYKEHLPSLRFIGKCYTNADRIGGFGHKWGQWFERYNCPRFTSPDELGNVILDYGMYLA